MQAFLWLYNLLTDGWGGLGIWIMWKNKLGNHKFTVSNMSDSMIEKHSGFPLFQSVRDEAGPGDSHMTADAQSVLICCFGHSASRTSSAAPTTARTR